MTTADKMREDFVAEAKANHEEAVRDFMSLLTEIREAHLLSTEHLSAIATSVGRLSAAAWSDGLVTGIHATD